MSERSIISENRGDLEAIRGMMLDGLYQFHQDSITREQLNKSFIPVFEAFFNSIHGKVTIEQVGKELIKWHKGLLKILEGPEEKKALTEREKRFIIAYRLCGNASKAARQAGYSQRTARQIACRILKKPHIKKALGRIADEKE